MAQERVSERLKIDFEVLVRKKETGVYHAVDSECGWLEHLENYQRMPRGEAEAKKLRPCKGCLAISALT